MVAGKIPRRGEVFLVEFDPTRGHEIRKTRPAMVISPDDLNGASSLVIVAPLTSAGEPLRYRVDCRFMGKAGRVLLDQIRAVDRSRLVRSLGRLTPAVEGKVLQVLHEMFAP